MIKKLKKGKVNYGEWNLDFSVSVVMEACSSAVDALPSGLLNAKLHHKWLNSPNSFTPCSIQNFN